MILYALRMACCHTNRTCQYTCSARDVDRRTAAVRSSTGSATIRLHVGGRASSLAEQPSSNKSSASALCAKQLELPRR